MKEMHTLIISILMFTTLSAHAGLAELDIRDGQLFGAQNVNVQGKLYDVAFLDGTCEELFGGCDSTEDFVFQTEQTARAAATALSIYVFTVNSIFDISPELTNGCADLAACLIYTSYGIEGQSANSAVFVNRNRGRNLGDVAIGIGEDLSDTQSGVFAKWSVIEVPNPSALSLLALGLVGLAMQRRR